MTMKFIFPSPFSYSFRNRSLETTTATKQDGCALAVSDASCKASYDCVRIIKCNEVYLFSCTHDTHTPLAPFTIVFPFVKLILNSKKKHLNLCWLVLIGCVKNPKCKNAHYYRLPTHSLCWKYTELPYIKFWILNFKQKTFFLIFARLTIAWRSVAKKDPSSGSRSGQSRIDLSSGSQSGDSGPIGGRYPEMWWDRTRWEENSNVQETCGLPIFCNVLKRVCFHHNCSLKCNMSNCFSSVFLI